MSRLRNIYFTFFFICNATLYCQSDTLNKFNASGKKSGYRKAFYTDRFEYTRDSLKGRYYDYEYYINGEVFRYILDKKYAKEMRIVYTPKGNSSNEKLLSGEVSYYDPNNKLGYKDEFLDGVIIKSHSYSYFKDSNHQYVMYYEELIDYTNLGLSVE